MNLDDQRAELKDVRHDLAERNQELANRILDARILRSRLEAEHRGGKRGVACSSDDKAEKAAKADAEYITYERETARLTYDRDLAIADAEARAYGIQAAIANAGVTV